MAEYLTDLPKEGPAGNPSTHDNPSAGILQTKQPSCPLEAEVSLLFLRGKILTPLLRELIIERGMALPNEVVGLDKLKVIVLMVLMGRARAM